MTIPQMNFMQWLSLHKLPVYMTSIRRICLLGTANCLHWYCSVLTASRVIASGISTHLLSFSIHQNSSTYSIMNPSSSTLRKRSIIANYWEMNANDVSIHISSR